MNLFSLKSLAVTVVLLMSGSVSAQYVWLDAKGTKQFSDRPPPASIPRTAILKEPVAELPTRTETTSDDPDTDKPVAPLSTAERNADFRKRRMEQADIDKKASDDKTAAAEKTANCGRAKAYQRTLEDGMRISSVDKNGERYTMNDEQREAEMRTVRKLVSDCR
ncbi:DUF4124 domain-containing protein [Actimicrobium sp. CCI2.3]|uniref:DUF4124 domain-containing protein n=1 Tax=Actimicrobium sp. CCI2.3 TaxID=3048616 RepID=UPI002AB5580E|nr:DUF4124 domain-containing protein [Actimicrobium sp. CCI2.3]MDY7572819.1 DUF4124 domain-containing protein [Actimicrobium sp. CCI2.3]MEB0020664.1 DUF4124 domain-containing protein [Actimicrobium sp. CCI2.3]